MKAIPAAEFKAKLFKLMDLMSRYNEGYIITRYGEPIAKVIPINSSTSSSKPVKDVSPEKMPTKSPAQEKV